MISLITITKDPCGVWHFKDQTEVLSPQHCSCGVTVIVGVNHGGSLRLETVSPIAHSEGRLGSVLMTQIMFYFNYIPRFALERQCEA